MLRSWSVWISLAALFLLALGPLLAFSGLVPGFQGFIIFVLAAPLGLIGVVAGLIAALRKRTKPGMVAVALGLAVTLAVVFPGFSSGGRPRINDISTDLEDVPALVQASREPENQGKDLGYPEAFKPTVREFYRKLGPLKVAAPPDAVFKQAWTLAKEQPHWTVTAVDPNARTIEGTVESRLFRFRDDFVVRVRPEGEGARVDMRSKSRVGKGDLGANAHRIDLFLEALGARTGAGAAPPAPAK